VCVYDREREGEKGGVRKIKRKRDRGRKGEREIVRGEEERESLQQECQNDFKKRIVVFFFFKSQRAIICEIFISLFNMNVSNII